MSIDELGDKEQLKRFLEVLDKPGSLAYCNERTLEQIRECLDDYPDIKEIIDKFRVCPYIDDGVLTAVEMPSFEIKEPRSFMRMKWTD